MATQKTNHEGRSSAGLSSRRAIAIGVAISATSLAVGGVMLAEANAAPVQTQVVTDTPIQVNGACDNPGNQGDNNGCRPTETVTATTTVTATATKTVPGPTTTVPGPRDWSCHLARPKTALEATEPKETAGRF